MDSAAVRLQATTTCLSDQLLTSAAAAAAANASILDDDELTSMKIRSIGFDIYFYSLSLFIIPVGVVCNLFSICVFVTSPTFRWNSTAQFLIALSITDCLVLVGDFLRCLSMRNPYYVYYTGLTFFDTSNFACKFIYYWRQRSIPIRSSVFIRMPCNRCKKGIKVLPHSFPSVGPEGES